MTSTEFEKLLDETGAEGLKRLLREDFTEAELAPYVTFDELKAKMREVYASFIEDMEERDFEGEGRPK